MTTVGIIGSGLIGGTVARLSVAAGHHVVVSNSRGPQTLGELVAELGPLARSAPAEQAGEAGDLDGGPLAGSWRQEPGTPVYGSPYGPFSYEVGTPCRCREDPRRPGRSAPVGPRLRLGAS